MLYPLKFKARFMERIWGGTLLSDSLGKALPKGKKIGESWEISGVDGNISIVANGKLKGNDLQELIEVYMGDLVGDKVYEKFGLEFPLLIKLLDAQEVISIQVHPDDELAGERHQSYGKTEMWYVIDCEADAELYIGFKGKVTREQYLEAVEAGNLPTLLNRVKAKPGDTFFIPAGVIHAIGGGNLIAEIQQTSDITYRVDDWGRVDDAGNPRQLHTELAVDSIDFDNDSNLNVTAAPITNSAVELASCQYFTTNIIEVSASLERDYASLDSFVIYTILNGDLNIVWDGGTEHAVKGDTILIPAQIDSITLKGNGKLLEVYIR